MTLFNDITTIDGEPRIRDLDLARRLQMVDPYKVRTLIAANRDELGAHGIVSARRAETLPQGGRPGTDYYLNEGQALTICALSRTPVAAKIRRALIDVFMSHRRGELKPVAVVAHNRRLPTRKASLSFSRQDQFESFFRAFRDQPEALAEWAETNARAMERTLEAFTGRAR